MDHLRLSIVMPVFNEEQTLPEIIRRVHAACGSFAEVIFVNDGSTDGSLAILRERARSQDRVLTKKNQGKGSAVRLGLAQARGRYIIIQDADLEYDPQEIASLLRKAEEENLPAVYGSRRLLTRPKIAHIKYYIGGVLLTYFVNILYGCRLTDQNTCYKLVRRDLAQSFPFRQNDFRFDCEMTVFLRRNGHHITELPISYHPRTAAQGKKIGYSDWFKSLWLLIILRFQPKSRMRPASAGPLFLIGISLVLVMLWLPNMRYPLVSDSMQYAHLSRNFWTIGSYQLLGAPHPYHMPLFPIASYWAIWLFGMNSGLKIASLLYGIAMYTLVFFFVRELRPADRFTSFLTVIFLVFSFPTVWLLSLGNADTFFGVLFFGALLAYMKAEHRSRLYLLSGLMIGLASLCRYPGLTLLPIIGLHALLTRRAHLRNPYFWIQFVIAIALFSLWPMRNFLTFGTLATGHFANEWQREGTAIGYLTRNLLYYIHPTHSIMLLAIPAVSGLIAHGRRYLLATIAIPGSMIFAFVYHAVTVRFMVVTIPLLMFFAAIGIADAWRRLPHAFVILFLVAALSVQTSFLCFYSLPQCHALIDRLHIPGLPQDFGWTQEGFESFQEAVDFVERSAPAPAEIAGVFIGEPDLAVWEDFARNRPLINARTQFSCESPAYAILASERDPYTRTPDYVTRNHPQFSVYALSEEECERYNAM